MGHGARSKDGPSIADLNTTVIGNGSEQLTYVEARKLKECVNWIESGSEGKGGVHR